MLEKMRETSLAKEIKCKCCVFANDSLFILYDFTVLLIVETAIATTQNKIDANDFPVFYKNNKTTQQNGKS